MEVPFGNNHLIGFEPNLDCSLHDGDLCTSGNLSSHLSNGIRHRRLRGGLFSTQTSNASCVSVVSSCYLRCAFKNLLEFSGAGQEQ